MGEAGVVFAAADEPLYSGVNSAAGFEALRLSTGLEVAMTCSGRRPATHTATVPVFDLLRGGPGPACRLASQLVGHRRRLRAAARGCAINLSVAEIGLEVVRPAGWSAGGGSRGLVVWL